MGVKQKYYFDQPHLGALQARYKLQIKNTNERLHERKQRVTYRRCIEKCYIYISFCNIHGAPMFKHVEFDFHAPVFRHQGCSAVCFMFNISAGLAPGTGNIAAAVTTRFAVAIHF